MKARKVDRLVTVTAPVLIGDGVTPVGDIGVRKLRDALRPRLDSIRTYGNEVVHDFRFDVEAQTETSAGARADEDTA